MKILKGAARFWTWAVVGKAIGTAGKNTGFLLHVRS